MSLSFKFFDSTNRTGAASDQVTAILPASARTFLSDRMSEFCGVALALVATFFLVAVISYRPDDPSLNSATNLAPANLLGHSGATIADILVQSFGYSAYLFIIGLLGWSWRIIRKQRLSLVGWRGVALIIATVTAGIGLSSLSVADDWPLPAHMGGVVGTLIHDRSISFLAATGWPHGGLQIGIAAAFMAVLFWIFGLGLTWREWQASGSTIGAGVLLLGHGFRKSCEAFLLVPAWSRHKLEAVERQKSAESLTASTDDDDPDDHDPEDIAVRIPVGGEMPAEDAPARTGLVAPRKPKPKTGKKAQAARQRKLDLEPDHNTYAPPPLDLLEAPIVKADWEAVNKDALEQNAKFLATVLQDFGIKGEIVKVRPGPVVTLYELEPAPGTKTSRVIGLSDDIARSMSAVSVRVAVVPGRNVIGIELPNVGREMVCLRELLASADFELTKSKLPLALGKDISGAAVVVDLARMPHLLIAGTTGSGKSVAMNTMILSLLYSLSPNECRLIMIDPKMLELSVYDNIPHLLSPVVTDPSKAVVALKWAVREMEDRYRNMSQLGVRNIAGYNARIEDALKRGDALTRRVQTGFDENGKPIIVDQPLPMEPLPFIVVVVDEMADLMLVAGKDVEAAIQRLAQMARAAGIHLIMATQRPSVDVITGTVKANFPTRVSFQVTSKIDSRTILGEQGAEQLLGQGDMLYMAGGGRITRVHGPFVSDDEVELIVSHLKDQGMPTYIEEVTIDDNAPIGPEAAGGKSNSADALYDEAVAIVAREGKASTSFIQRHLQIGYNRAARIIEQMEKEGVISPANRVGRREVLVGSH
jgi:DNA segregation ATPase FtsK/SpoIIIE, S-DNA-T family